MFLRISPWLWFRPLPMLTATLERALAGPVTGPVTVWSRNGVPAALHCRS